MCFQTGWVKTTERGWYERDHKTFRETINWASRNHFLFPWWKGVLGACSGPKWPPTAPLEHPEKVLSFRKEAERGWKSGPRSLSWKSEWKPSISRYKQISYSKSLLLLKGHFQSGLMYLVQCSITRVCPRGQGKGRGRSGTWKYFWLKYDL